MKIIRMEANPSGSRPPLQDWAGPTPPSGYAFLPGEFVSVFYAPDKQAAGFVEITVEDGAVTACTWNEEAYQAYIAGLPEPEPETPADSEPVTWSTMAAAIRAGVNEV